MRKFVLMVVVPLVAGFTIPSFVGRLYGSHDWPLAIWMAMMLTCCALGFAWGYFITGPLYGERK